MFDVQSIDAPRVRATPDGRVTRREAARVLGVAERTLANWKSRRCGPRQLRLRGRVFYRMEDLQSFIEAEGRC